MEAEKLYDKLSKKERSNIQNLYDKLQNEVTIFRTKTIRAFVVTSTQNHRIIHLTNIIKI